MAENSSSNATRAAVSQFHSLSLGLRRCLLSPMLTCLGRVAEPLCLTCETRMISMQSMMYEINVEAQRLSGPTVRYHFVMKVLLHQSFAGKRTSMRLMLNNMEVIDELSMNQESTPPAWAMFGIVSLLPGKKELGKWQNYLGARRPWSLFANKIL